MVRTNADAAAEQTCQLEADWQNTASFEPQENTGAEQGSDLSSTYFPGGKYVSTEGLLADVLLHHVARWHAVASLPRRKMGERGWCSSRA